MVLKRDVWTCPPGTITLRSSSADMGRLLKFKIPVTVQEWLLLFSGWVALRPRAAAECPCSQDAAFRRAVLCVVNCFWSWESAPSTWERCFFMSFYKPKVIPVCHYSLKSNLFTKQTQSCSSVFEANCVRNMYVMNQGLQCGDLKGQDQRNGLGLALQDCTDDFLKYLAPVRSWSSLRSPLPSGQGTRSWAEGGARVKYSQTKRVSETGCSSALLVRRAGVPPVLLENGWWAAMVRRSCNRWRLGPFWILGRWYMGRKLRFVELFFFPRVWEQIFRFYWWELWDLPFPVVRRKSELF